MDELLKIIELSIDYADDKINRGKISISTINNYHIAIAVLDCIKHGIKKNNFGLILVMVLNKKFIIVDFLIFF